MKASKRVLENRAMERERLVRRSFNVWRALFLIDQRYAGDLKAAPTEEVLQALYDDRLVAFDEDTEALKEQP